jgi:hypothetical protein
MKRRWVATGLAAASLAAALVGATAVASAGVAAGVVVLPEDSTFGASSHNPTIGDLCPMGFVEGRFSWTETTLRVSGVLTDRPATPGDGECGQDGYYSFVIVRAFTPTGPGPTAAYRVDNGELPFEFTWPTPFYVTVEVCRDAPGPEPPPYCGRPHEIPTA